MGKEQLDLNRLVLLILAILLMDSMILYIERQPYIKHRLISTQDILKLERSKVKEY